MLLVAVDNSFSMRAGTRMADAKNAGAGRSGQLPSRRSRAGHRLCLRRATADAARRPTRRNLQRRRASDSAGRRPQRVRRNRARDPLTRSARWHAGGSAHLHRWAEVVHARAVFRTRRSARYQADGSFRCRPDEPNWYVEAVHAPRSVYQPKKVRIQAVVAGVRNRRGGDERLAVAERQIAGISKGQASGQRPCDASSSILPDAAYGMNRGEVRIDSRDKLAADDTYPFSIERKEAQRVLVIA